MKFGKIIVSIQLYFTICLIYFMIGGINEDILNQIGIVIFHILLYSAFFFIISPFIYFFVTKKVDYKRELKYIIPALFLTIILFEFVFKQ